ncbi:DUF6157 family protein [Niabella soli]|uniref:Uncharacterized protein n=1 Tax=Niabella soli DSM 19437 TaxID=929713 RepID=W0F1C3_9BACT|nr:DUF6157 family protein [Niabella soli]AHF15239.1 hypothetical protein NIASO_08840 [Niabella soli DSM 19437]
MNGYTTNYINTFIQTADDSPAVSGEVPPLKGDKKTAANIQFELISKHPYKYTSDDVLFQVYANKNDLTKAEYKSEREKFFSKGQPCLRASPLTKRYGWGIHSNAEGRIALYGVETETYKKLSRDGTLKIVKAMKSGR